MPWWMWVGLLLGWVVLACGAAVWMGASAKVIRAKEREAARSWRDDDVEWRRERHDAA